MQQKRRLDALLVEKGLFVTREKAKAAIMAGLVRVDGEVSDKPGTKVPVDVPIEVTAQLHPYVGRGGLKLEKALKFFHFDIEGHVVLDIGASTGGFTDCALQHGAKHVYAIDVGYGQLDWKLRQDPRVTVMERTNFRYVIPEQFIVPPPDVAVIDVSFISLEKILPPLKAILPEKGVVISLIKPQFEAGKEQVGKKGVVRDPSVHREVLRRTLEMAQALEFQVNNLTYSPITGGEGNIEFLVYWTKERCAKLGGEEIRALIEHTVDVAHRKL